MTDEEHLAEYAQLIADASADYDPQDTPVLLATMYVATPTLDETGVFNTRTRWEILAAPGEGTYAQPTLILDDDEEVY